MARFVLALLAIAVTISFTSVIRAAPQDNLIGKVFFLEGGRQEYLRQSIAEGNLEEQAISGGDTAAAIAVLLGVPPPLMLSSTSSSRLDSLLSPDPFNRPHAVVALTIRGITSELPTNEGLLGSSSVQQRSLYANGFQRPHELAGQDVALHYLNHGEYSGDLDQGLEALAAFLEGSYDKEEQTDKIVLKIPLPLADDFSISFDFEKRADRDFVVELLSLFHLTQSAPGLKRGQEAKLFLGTFSALELMEEGSDHRQDTTKLFLHTAARVLSALEARYNGEIVGVFTLLSSARGMLPMFSMKEFRSSRSLLLDGVAAPAPSPTSANQSRYDAEIRTLMSRSLLFVTTLILLIATGLGSCFLLYMPLTRDTLLYANVKLD